MNILIKKRNFQKHNPAQFRREKLPLLMDKNIREP